MPFITNRDQAKSIIDEVAKKKATMAIFCTASQWNTEAVLRAAQTVARKYGFKRIPIALAMTSNYDYMQQTKRVTRNGSAKIGLRAVMEYAKILCDGPEAPYPEVDVLPHLDHADPVKDSWELTEGLDFFCSVMFDAQKYSFEENIQLTSEYIKKYGHKVLVEGAVESLAVGGAKCAHQNEDYIEKATEYVKKTGIDFLVADLGTEQQSEGTEAKYLKTRAVELTESLGKPMLVLHGTSSLSNEDIKGFAEDGVIRVNMWTRIVRESGQYAAKRLMERYGLIENNNFEACEAKQFIDDNIDHAAEIMAEVMESIGYSEIGL